MSVSQLDYLDELALDVAKGQLDALGALSRGELVYVCLAANRPDLLPSDTIAEALSRLGSEWTAELVARWQYKGNPAQ